MTAQQTLEKMGLSESAEEVIGKQFNGTFYYNEIRSKTGKRHGVEYGGTVLKGHKARIMLNEYIHIHGQEWNHRNAPVDFSMTFYIGDRAEYDSYNLKYTGLITAIKEKYIEITEPNRQRHAKHRLSIHEFSWRNWDFNAVKIANENADTMMTI